MKTLLLSLPPVLALAALAPPLAHAGEHCFDFGRLDAGTECAVDAAAPVEIGAGTPHPVRVEFRQPKSTREAGRIDSEVRVEGKQGIKSFADGAAELRLDDVCFGK